MPTITDATVVAQAYDTSGNGGRKFVKLDSGALVAAAKDATSQFVWKTTDNWNTKTVIASQTGYVSSQDVALCTDGKNIFRLFGYNNSTIVFNSWTESGVILTSLNLDTGQTALGNVSLAINEAKTELHAAWASKNATYPNSFNIRYAKGTINADGTVTWGAVEQWTILNNTGLDASRPSIFLDKNNIPSIVIDATFSFVEGGSANSSNRSIVIIKKSNELATSSYINSGYTFKTIFSIATYVQSSPSAIYVPQSINGLANGLVANAWHGTDSTDTSTNYIRFSKSIDGGTTWSTMQKLVVGTNASLTANKSGKLFITYEDAGVTKRIESTDNGANWSSAITVGTGTNPSTLFDLSVTLSAPLTIRKGASSVLFSGTWMVTTISVTPGDIGQKTDRSSLLAYSITTDGEMSTITEKINGTVVNTRNTTSGQAVTLGLTQAQWDAIRFGKYANATGGKNTLTVEMGTDKWTYTFDKRLATDADILSATKAVKDTNEVYLPAQISRLADAAKGKGAVIPSNPKIDDIVDGIKNAPSGRTLSGTVTSTSTNYPFVSANGTAVNVPKCTVTELPFNPSRVLMWNSSTNVQSAMYVKEGLHYFGGLAVATCGANYYRADNISNVLGFVLPVLAPGTVFNWVAYE